MRKASFAGLAYDNKKKKTRREKFLEDSMTDIDTERIRKITDIESGIGAAAQANQIKDPGALSYEHPGFIRGLLMTC
jgi:hypothetical protein